MKCLITFAVLFGLVADAQAQAQEPRRAANFVRESRHQDTLSEVIPLNVGNQWTYHMERLDGDPNWISEHDSGTVTIRITGKIASVDSVRWLLHQEQKYIHCISKFGYNTNCSSLIADSLDFEVVEQLSGRHRVYRNSSEIDISASVFPWSRDLTDTTSIYRFAITDTSGAKKIGIHSAGIPFAYPFIYQLTFRHDTGLSEIDVTRTITTGLPFYSRYFLLSKVITSVKVGQAPGLAGQLSLLQNYPNPFNPSTTIRVYLPSEDVVFLGIYNSLGQEIQFLFSGKMSSGWHRFDWTASSYSSGVYFCRFKTGHSIVTSRLLYLR